MAGTGWAVAAKIVGAVFHCLLLHNESYKLDPSLATDR
jgi:hypothetical protein